MVSFIHYGLRPGIVQLARRDASLLKLCLQLTLGQVHSRQVTTGRAKRTPRKKTHDAAEVKSDVYPLESRLPLLSLTSLRNLALLCGRNFSGTRAVLRADLEAAISEVSALLPRSNTSVQRILSIDMGVRNLAYCLLQVDNKADRSSGHPVTQLVAWKRLSLIGGEKDIAGNDTASAELPASAFSPPAMATVAARLVRDQLLPLAPTHILIERQRFRSGGGAAVLEWTVRVNSLEAMLHGILAYQQLGASNKSKETNNGTFQSIQAISPQRVSQFLLRGGLDSSGEMQLLDVPAKLRKDKHIKDAKEAFVARVLRLTGPKQLLTYGESTKDIVDAYLFRWDAKQSKSRRKTKTKADGTDAADASGASSNSKPVFSKIDDMADCVVQGLAWLEWEENKRTLQLQGAEKLLATKQIAG
ncbi:MAG: hypothetical protein SEPTF4163_000147 [Sporothrix epigloea]